MPLMASTYADFIRAKVAEGKDEPQIWAAMKRKYGLTDDSKRRYIKWYLPANTNRPRKKAA